MAFERAFPSTIATVLAEGGQQVLQLSGFRTENFANLVAQLKKRLD
jgi:hypothetical protein